MLLSYMPTAIIYHLKFIALFLFHFSFDQNYNATDGIQKVTEDFNCKPVEGNSYLFYKSIVPSLISKVLSAEEFWWFCFKDD